MCRRQKQNFKEAHLRSFPSLEDAPHAEKRPVAAPLVFLLFILSPGTLRESLACPVCMWRKIRSLSCLFLSACGYFRNVVENLEHKLHLLLNINCYSLNF